MKQIVSQRCSYLIVLIASLGLATPALANRQASARAAGAKRPAALAATKPRALVATTPRSLGGKPGIAWRSGWQSLPTESGVTIMTRQSEPLATDGTPAGKNVVFIGQTGRGNPRGGSDYSRIDIGALVFEPQPAGQHRVLLRLPNNATFEALPTRTSAGANGRRAVPRTVNDGGWTSRVELVQFFQGAQQDKRTTYYAAYGEVGLVGADGTQQTLTHLINVTTRRIVSLPYKFISIWNGDGTSPAYVMVEPLKADGKPDVGTVLGISIDALKQNFARTLADPSKWTVLVNKI